MKHFKTFLNLFKRKYSESDKIVINIIDRLKKEDVSITVDARGVQLVGDVISGKHIHNINFNIKLTDMNINIGQSVNTQGVLIGEPTDIPLHLMDSRLSNMKEGWDEKIQERFITEGAIKKWNTHFYKLTVNDEPVSAEYNIIEDLFHLSNKIYNNGKL